MAFVARRHLAPPPALAAAGNLAIVSPMPHSKRVHLVCNAHLDPVWLWTWEDGMAEAIATFRVAADFCQKHEGFVFNHNEALLYDWVEQHDPALFKRIRRLVKEKRWHIAGGAWLQPDVNGPGGESHIRQLLHGLDYFTSRFGARPTTAYNFDPFGHPEGFAQILAGCGFDSYIFCRPDFGSQDLPVGAFDWSDRSGATVIARRSDDHYNSTPARTIADKLEKFLAHYADEPTTLILWGIGNHGGGPSQLDWKALQRYIREHRDTELVQSTPEAFFDELRKAQTDRPRVVGEIQNSAPGCYTSMARLKRVHREAESLLSEVERLAALAWWGRGADYPQDELKHLWRDVLFAQFHDILPGSMIAEGERQELQRLGGVCHQLRRIRAQTMTTLVKQQRPPKAGHTPLWLFNPHGRPLDMTVELEPFLGNCLPPNTTAKLHRDGKTLRYQRIAPRHNTGNRAIQRLAVPMKLDPFEVARIDVEPVAKRDPLPPKPPGATRANLTFTAKQTTVRINPRTGLIDELRFGRGAKSLVKPGALQPALFRDLDHSWTCGDPKQPGAKTLWLSARGWRKPAMLFKLATAEQAAQLSPLPEDKYSRAKRTKARPVRIIEHGPIRTTVEAMFVCGPSAIVRQYIFDHAHGLLEVRDRVFMNHRDHMLKLLVPLTRPPRESVSETPYSAVRREPTDIHEDRPNQRWAAVVEPGGAWLGIANSGSFAHSLTADTLALNVLRAPAYSSFNLRTDRPFQPGRFKPRQDQGEHEVAWAITGGRRFAEPKMTDLAAALNTPPTPLVWFSAGGDGQAPLPRVTCEPECVEIVALKKADRGNALIVRLREQAGKMTTAKVAIGRDRFSVELAPYGLQTVALRRSRGKLNVKKVNLVEGL